MGKKLPPDQLKLYKRIDEILWNDWDPIGVNDIEDARDEYQSYLPHIFRLALEGKDEHRISGSLLASVRDNMGLSGNKSHSNKIAKLIIEARNEILESTN